MGNLWPEVFMRGICFFLDLTTSCISKQKNFEPNIFGETNLLQKLMIKSLRPKNILGSKEFRFKNLLQKI